MGLLSESAIDGGRLLSAAACCVFVCAGAQGAEWELSLDLRALSSSGQTSFLEDGQGKLRFDQDHEGIQLGRLRAAWTQPLGEVFSAHAEISRWDAVDKNPIDLTEAYLEYKPYPSGGWRSRVRLGAFYPPMSLENRARGWETPYTITPSAISSWIGEEIRTIGIEAQTDWLGTREGKSFDLQFTGAIFGWNDPAGTMLAKHGFALHDRQTTLFGRVGEPQSDPTKPRKEVFHEMDGRPGYYIGAQARYLDRAVLNVLHYDNRADPTVQSAALRDLAWKTRFDAFALRIESAGDWTLLLQALDGDTEINPFQPKVWDFNSSSAMLARRWGKGMLAARYDDFEIEMDDDPARPGSEVGHAWTFAYSYELEPHWRFALEWLQVDSNVRARITSLAEPPFASESKLELSVRYALSGHL